MERLWTTLSLPEGMPQWATLLTVATAAIFLYHWLSQPRNLPPGPHSWPLVGNMISAEPEISKYMVDVTARYGPMARLWYGPRLVVVLGSHDLIQQAFVTKSDVFSARPEFLYNVNLGIKSIGRGVIWQNGEPLKLMRRLMLQTMRDFGVGRRSLEERIQEEVTVVSSRLEAAQGSPYVIKADLQRATTNVICTIVFGRRWDYGDPEFEKLVATFTTFFTAGPIRPVSVFPFLRVLALLSKTFKRQQQLIRELFAFLVKNIKEHEETFDPDHPRDLVDVYLKAQKEGMHSDVLTTRNLQRGIMDVFLAGSETTATVLDWAVLFMLLHPDVQEKCQAQIDQVVGAGRQVGMSDRSSLPYVVATILETMRLGNTLHVSLPHCTTRETTLAGFTIPANTLVYGNLLAAHLDPNVWPNPMTFRPERFLDAQGRLIKNHASVPFSTGPRVCLGEPLARMEIFLIFANLLQRFALSKVKDAVLTTESNMGLTNGPKAYCLLATKR